MPIAWASTIEELHSLVRVFNHLGNLLLAKANPKSMKTSDFCTFLGCLLAPLLPKTGELNSRVKDFPATIPYVRPLQSIRLTAEPGKNLSALSGVAYNQLGAILPTLVAPNPAPKKVFANRSRMSYEPVGQFPDCRTLVQNCGIFCSPMSGQTGGCGMYELFAACPMTTRQAFIRNLDSVQPKARLVA